VDARPPHLNEWVPLSAAEQWEWLDAACKRHFARSTPWPPDAPPGTVFTLPGQLITSLSAFFCAMGEAVNGPGGYFGWTLRSLQDCAVGGFGAAPPFIVRWKDATHSRRALGHEALRQWAEKRLHHRDFFDADGERWLRETLARAARGEGETLFDRLVEALGVRGSVVEEH
jgi:hypothetical protein